MCDICGGAVKEYTEVLGGICVCRACVKNIIILHIYSRKIKLLCPTCSGMPGPCDECDTQKHVLAIDKYAYKMLDDLKALDV